MLKPQPNNDSWRDDTEPSTSTTAEGKTRVEVASENGVDPVITEVNKEVETTVTAYSLSEQNEEGETPVINDAKEEKEERREMEVATNGIEEVKRREKTESELSNNVSIYSIMVQACTCEMYAVSVCGVRCIYLHANL